MLPWKFLLAADVSKHCLCPWVRQQSQKVQVPTDSQWPWSFGFLCLNYDHCFNLSLSYMLLLLLLSHFSRVRLCNPMDGSPPGSPILGILQARTLEWVAISFSNAWKWKVKVKSLIRVWLLATPWTAAYQAPPSMGISRQEYWSGVPLPSPVVS